MTRKVLVTVLLSFISLVGIAQVLPSDLPATASCSDLGQGWMSANLVTTSGSGKKSEAVVATQGKVLNQYDKHYLITYIALAMPFDFSKALDSPVEIGNKIVKDIVITNETKLTLTLIQVDKIDSISRLSPLDFSVLTRGGGLSDDSPDASNQAMTSAVLFPIFAQARAKAREVASASNVRQLESAALMYCQDWDEKFPMTKSFGALKACIYPYVKSEGVFKALPGRAAYTVNPYLSRISLGAINSPAVMAFIYESDFIQGHKVCGFADGHVKSVSVEEWERVKKASHIK